MLELDHVANLVGRMEFGVSGLLGWRILAFSNSCS